MESYRDVEDIKKQIWDEYRGEDNIGAIEPLIRSIMDGGIKIVKRQESGENKPMTYIDIISEMNKDCKPFFIYKEDIMMKDKFF